MLVLGGVGDNFGAGGGSWVDGRLLGLDFQGLLFQVPSYIFGVYGV